MELQTSSNSHKTQTPHRHGRCGVLSYLAGTAVFSVRRQRVQRRTLLPSTFRGWMLTSWRCFEAMLEWERVFPTIGPRPQALQTRDIGGALNH